MAFSPDGPQLIVTTKANGNDIDVFGVGFDGRLSAAPVVNSEPGTVPFAISFDRPATWSSPRRAPTRWPPSALHGNGTVTLLDAVGTGQSATCWVAPARGYFFASNAGSAIDQRLLGRPGRAR